MNYFIEEFVKNKMTPGKWYPVKPENIETLKQLNIKDRELTFNENYSKVKVTLWVNGSPAL